MQTLGRDEAAMSPVLATVLLVSIVVTLGAGVMLVAGKIQGTQATKPPVLAFTTDTARGQAQVVLADPGLDWSRDLVLSGSCAPLLNGSPFPGSPGTPVTPGDVLSCGTGEELRIVSTPSGGSALLFRAHF